MNGSIFLLLAVIMAIISITSGSVEVQSVQINKDEMDISRFVPSLNVQIVKNEKITFHLEDTTLAPTGKLMAVLDRFVEFYRLIVFLYLLLLN